MLVANHVPPEREVIIHSENGILGMGPEPAPNEINRWLINASKKYVTLRPGGAYMHHADSFAIIRGGHLDLCILGAFQVAENGDFANWSMSPTDMPSVGGAMDLAVGAKQVWVVMDHATKSGESKLVRRCTYPLTAPGAVSRVYTNLAVLDVTRERLCRPRDGTRADLRGVARSHGSAAASRDVSAATRRHCDKFLHPPEQLCLARPRIVKSLLSRSS